MGPATPAADDLRYDWYDSRQVGPEAFGADDLRYDGYDWRAVGPATLGADVLRFDSSTGEVLLFLRSATGRVYEYSAIGFRGRTENSGRSSGMNPALEDAMATARHYRDLIAWQLAELFATEIQRLVHGSAGARADFRFRDQLLGAAEGVSANVAEGFLRFSPADLGRFLTYALGSLAEAETRLEHGVHRGYFSAGGTSAARQLARRTLTAIVRLKQSQTQRRQPER